MQESPYRSSSKIGKRLEKESCELMEVAKGYVPAKQCYTCPKQDK
jgi:hypothetical protein